MKPTILSDATFKEEVLQSDIPVIVDFWATWCVSCKALDPILESLATDYEGKVKVCKADIADNPSIAAKYGIKSMPTILFFKNGEVAGMIVGAVSKQHFIKKINEL